MTACFRRQWRCWASRRSGALRVAEQVLPTSLPASLAPLGLKYLEEHELRRTFDEYDSNGNGSIDAQELRAMLRDAGAAGDSLAEAEGALSAPARKGFMRFPREALIGSHSGTS